MKNIRISRACVYINSYLTLVALEAEVELYVHEVVVVLGQRAVVDAGILGVDLQLRGEVVVQSDLVNGLLRIPILGLAVSLVAGLGVELRLHYGHDAEGIPTVGLVAQRGVGTHTLRMQVLSAESVLVLVVFG